MRLAVVAGSSKWMIMRRHILQNVLNSANILDTLPPGVSGTAWRALLLLALALAGCGDGDREARARAAAEGYLQAVKEKDPDRAMAFFAKSYFETRSTAGWKADLRLITSRLGALQSYSLKGWTWRTDFVPPDSGTHVTLRYEVKYAKHTATETFVVFKPFARGEHRIVGHTIASKGLTLE